MLALDKAIVGLNNLAVKSRRSRAKSGQLLLLFSSCLQRSECQQQICNDLDECRRCGQCPVKGLLELADEFGAEVSVATGGSLALERARDASVKAVVAVACQKELREGLLGCFPKPVLAVSIDRPNGPCRDTAVDLEAVRQALQWFRRD